jgi:uncharacterized membrane protein YqjE
MNWFFLFIALGCVSPLVVWGLALDSMFRIRNVVLAVVTILVTGAVAGFFTFSLLHYWDSVL